jgi:outer membrane lipoprotein carrier protein
MASMQFVLKRWLKVVCLSIGMLPLVCHATGLEDLHHFVAQFQSAKGSFTQTVTAPSKKVTTSTGDFVFARPGKFRWSYLKPYNQVLVADGKNLTVYDADLNQATVRKLGDALGATPAAILFGDNRLESNFDLKELPPADGIDWVEATPKSHDTTFRAIDIGFKGGQLAAMKIADALGQETQLQFANVISNASIPADTFRFVPPPGADVLAN